MFLIPLTATPNQSLELNLDGAYWELHIFQAVNSLCANVTLNGTPLINGVRCYVGQGLMPYAYMHEPNYGNFVFDASPDWTQFGGNGCNLWYMTTSEYEQFKLMLLTGSTNIPTNIPPNLLNWLGS
jgi:hypothetical protein